MNVLRSLARYVSSALGEEWEVRHVIAEVFGRPLCRITPSTPLTSTAHGPFYCEHRQSFAIVAFPVVGLTEEAAAFESAHVAELLLDAFQKGIDPAGYSTRSGRAHPRRIPCFDYDGIMLGQAAPESARAGWLRVIEPPSVSSFADPMHDRAYVATCDVRLAWMRSVAIAAPGQLTQRVTIVGGE